MIDRASNLSAAQIDAPITMSVEGIDENPTLRASLNSRNDPLAWEATRPAGLSAP
jgi:hypothetical protein